MGSGAACMREPFMSAHGEAQASGVGQETRATVIRILSTAQYYKNPAPILNVVLQPRPLMITPLGSTAAQASQRSWGPGNIMLLCIRGILPTTANDTCRSTLTANSQTTLLKYTRINFVSRNNVEYPGDRAPTLTTRLDMLFAA